jgi:hypothetical protein
VRSPIIIVDDISQNISSSYWTFYTQFWRRYRKVLILALVWPGVVVLFPILPKNAVKAVFIQNQDMV